MKWMMSDKKDLMKYTGVVLFMAGFICYLLVFFLASYRLTDDQIKKLIDKEEQGKMLASELLSIQGQKYSSSFGFVNDITSAIEAVNERQLSRYAINETDLEKLLDNSPGGSFDISILEETFDPGDPVGQFKIQSFRDFGSWLDGRNFSGRDELKNQLTSISSNIRKYGIINKKGYDKYRTRDLKYTLTKAASYGPVRDHKALFLFLTFGLCMIGGVLYFIPGLSELPGIKNNRIFFNAITNGGWMGILIGTFLILFYVLLYFFPEHMTNWIIMVDPVSMALNGSEAGRFFLYGLMYTITILVMGIRMLIKYRGNRYQLVRTLSVMFFQTAFAFLIPEILVRLNQPYFDFKNIWPLDYDFFFDSELNSLIANGGLGVFMIGWGIALIVIAVPVFVYFFGKRWYCSWVCGCGGLAETMGDPFRQLSDKKLSAWKIERWMVHGVLVFAVVMTIGVLYTYWTGQGQVLGLNTYTIREAYGFWIGALFAGVVGTGFYPLMGNRVWCRFGCPLAAYLGLVQRFKSRFRITTNGGQCISCGNCSTYCEMGIDVRWYAQRGQNIVRSSCVGCGVCSSVCPRGVLKLENGPESGRFRISALVGQND